MPYQYGYHKDAEFYQAFDEAHEKGEKPYGVRYKLRVCPKRFRQLLRLWCERRGIPYRECLGHSEGKRVGAALGNGKKKEPSRQIDYTKPAFSMPLPLDRPGVPRTQDEIEAFKRAELAAVIAKAIHDYHKSNWARPLKKHQPHGFRIGPGQKVPKFYGATTNTKSSGATLRQQLNGFPSEESWTNPHDLSAGWRERDG